MGPSPPGLEDKTTEVNVSVRSVRVEGNVNVYIVIVFRVIDDFPAKT